MKLALFITLALAGSVSAQGRIDNRLAPAPAPIQRQGQIENEALIIQQLQAIQAQQIRDILNYQRLLDANALRLRCQWLARQEAYYERIRKARTGR